MTRPAGRPRPTRTRPRASELVRTREQFITEGNLAIRRIDPQTIAKLFEHSDDQRESLYIHRQPRYGEETRAVSPGHQLRAIFANSWFWEIVAELPVNNLADQSFGRSRHYPSYLLFLLAHCAAGLSAYRTRQAVATALEDRNLWATLVHYIDQYVPEGWTKVHECTHAKPRKALPKARTQKVTDFRHAARARRTERRQEIRHLVDCPDVAAPRAYHLDYFNSLLCGHDKHGNPLTQTSPWSSALNRVNDAFERCAVEQAQLMGVLDPDQPFQWHTPDRDQAAGWDGTVFRMTEPKSERDARHKARKAKKQWQADPCAPFTLHSVAGGDRTEYGSKWVLASTRVDGQPGSRIYLQAAHASGSNHSDYNDESAAVLAMAPRLRDLSNGGLKIVLMDSALRGRALQHLQRHEDLVVVNYPHAESNTDRVTKGRLNNTRTEKSHLRTCAEHTAADGTTCRHLIYAIGGELADLAETTDGGWTLVPVTEDKYERRPGKPRHDDTCRLAYCTDPGCTNQEHHTYNTCREYKIVTITCATAGDFQHRIPLFHSDAAISATGTDPNYNWGEVCRTFAPSSDAFKYLYGARNDTESRHADLKDRIRYLTRDITGQRLRILGAMFASNAQNWHIHQQLHREPNVIDETA